MSLVGATSGFVGHAIYLIAAIPMLVAIVIACIVWRNARKERGSHELWTSLASPDPEVRRGALEAIDDDSLAFNAPLLSELLKVEGDRDVLEALAASVARSNWEPTTDHSLLELRGWVAGGHAKTSGTSRVTNATGHLEGDMASVGASVGPTRGDGAMAAGVLDLDGAVVTSDGLSARQLDELVPKVRALLGDDLERLELVSIDGEVIARWTAGANAPNGSEANGD